MKSLRVGTLCAGDLTANNILLVEAADDDIRNFSAKVPTRAQGIVHLWSRQTLPEPISSSLLCYRTCPARRFSLPTVASIGG